MASGTVSLSKTVWTEISTLANGLVTNESQYMQVIQQAASLPSAGDISGHSMPSGKSFNWAGIGENMYARALPSQISPGTDCEVTAQV